MSEKLESANRPPLSRPKCMDWSWVCVNGPVMCAHGAWLCCEKRPQVAVDRIDGWFETTVWSFEVRESTQSDVEWENPWCCRELLWRKSRALRHASWSGFLNVLKIRISENFRQNPHSAAHTFCLLRNDWAIRISNWTFFSRNFNPVFSDHNLRFVRNEKRGGEEKILCLINVYCYQRVLPSSTFSVCVLNHPPFGYQCIICCFQQSVVCERRRRKIREKNKVEKEVLYFAKRKWK